MILDWTEKGFDVIGADVMVGVSGEAPTSTPPTVPGLEFTLPCNRMHFVLRVLLVFLGYSLR